MEKLLDVSLNTRSTASKRKPGDIPATPLNISSESIQAIRGASSPDIERSNESYYQKGKEEAVAEFAELHAAYMDLQQRSGIWLTPADSPVRLF